MKFLSFFLILSFLSAGCGFFSGEEKSQAQTDNQNTTEVVRVTPQQEIKIKQWL